MPIISYLSIRSIYRGIVLVQEASRRNRFSIVLFGQIHLALVLAISIHILLVESSFSPFIYLTALGVALAFVLCALDSVKAAIRFVSTHARITQHPQWDILSDKMVLLEFYRIWTSSLGRLTAKITGIENLRLRFEELSKREPMAKKIEQCDDGSIITSRIAQQLDQISEGSIVDMFTDPLNEMFSVCRGMFGKHLFSDIDAMAGKMPIGHDVFEKRPEILNSLFGGLLVGRAGTGTYLDRKIRGGFPTGSSVLLIGEPCMTRERFVSLFLERALEAGYGVTYVTSIVSPERIKEKFPNKINLRIVDCYTAQIMEVSGYSHKEGVFTCPNIAVLPHAIRETLDDLGPDAVGGRALIDLLPSYLNLLEVGEVWRNLVKIISMFKERQVTSLYTLEPGFLQIRGGSNLEELFDSVVKVTEGRENTPRIEMEKIFSVPRNSIDHDIRETLKQEHQASL